MADGPQLGGPPRAAGIRRGCKLMKHLARSLVATLVLFGVPRSSGASAPAPGTQGRKTEKPKGASPAAGANRQEILARLLGLLYSTVQDSKKWDDHVAAARVQAQVADLTWEADSLTARAHLAQAWETAGSIKDEAGQSPHFSESKRAEARRELMLIARRRDPELASRWLAEMAGEAEERRDGTRRGVFDDRTERSAVLLRMAAETVRENPQAAAELAVASLRDGISFGLQNVLLSLQARDFDLARKVFGAAMSRLRASGMTDPGELLILHSYLYTPGMVIGANQTPHEGSFSLSVSRELPATKAPATLDPALAQAFLALAADILISSPLPSSTADPGAAARAQISVIQVVIGEIAKHFPDKASILKARMADIAQDAQFKPAPPDAESAAGPGSTADPEQDAVGQYVSSLEERAKKETDPLARDQLYARAALAAGADNYERSLGLAQKVRDSALRRSLESVVRYRAAVHFALTGEMEKSYVINTGNDDPLHRASSLVVGAQRLATTGKTSTADQWLREASDLVRKAEDGEGQARVMLGAAAVYIKFDGASALESLTQAVKFINSAPAMPADGRAPLNRRFSGLPFGDFIYETAGFGLDSVISASDLESFERMLTALNEISSAERRGLAIVLLCRRHLRSAEPPTR